jgi:hypothetical protein
MANKVFNIPELNKSILKNINNIKNFSIINKTSYQNSFFFLSVYKKIIKNGNKHKKIDNDLDILYDIYYRTKTRSSNHQTYIYQ